MVERIEDSHPFQPEILLPPGGRRGARSRHLAVFHGELAVKPTLVELKDKSKFWSIKRALLPIFPPRKRGLIRENSAEVLPFIVSGSEVVILRLCYQKQQKQGSKSYFSYYVPASQVITLQEQFTKHQDWLAQQFPEFQKRRVLRSGIKLSPEVLEGLAEKISQEFGENEPIFYRADPRLRRLLGISRQTLNDILFIARINEKIPIPQGGSGQNQWGGPLPHVFYFREEIATALKCFAQLRRQGEGLAATAHRLRDQVKLLASNRLTLKDLV